MSGPAMTDLPAYTGPEGGCPKCGEYGVRTEWHWAGGVRVDFTVYRVPRDGEGRKPCPAGLVSQSGPGDGGDLVVTIMQPGED
jgi:hypothetical protein